MDLSAIRMGEIVERVTPYKIPLILASISIAVFSVAIVLFLRSHQTSDSIEFVMGEATTSADVAQPKIIVDVSGGVLHPGVYSLPVGSRIQDAIQIAGGLSQKANQELIEKSINRAALVGDGAKLYIPIRVDETTSYNDKLTQQTNASTTSHNISSPETSRGLISVNSASQEVLESLPGIGPVTAQKIIAGRPYMSIDELTAKKIVGKKVFEQIQPQISL